VSLHISPDLDLPNDAVTETFAILANRGKGKSSTAHVLVEEMYAAGLPVVVLDVKGDWWGLRSSADGKGPGLPFVVFGGDHADVPLEPTAGELVADLIVDERVACILDMSLMSKTKARSFTTTFAERLYRRNREALHVLVDEADVLVPQRASADTARLLGAMEDIAKRGRQRGLGITLVTQRPQEVAKSVLDLCETLFLLGMTGPRSIKAIQDWVSVNVDEGTSVGEVIGSLPSLQVGEAWVWSPALLRLLKRTTVRRIRTFDSHATPKPGQALAAPRGRAEVDLAALGQRIADTVERAKADDPRALRARIRDLEKQLGDIKPEVQIVEVPVLADELAGRLETALTDLRKYGEDITGVSRDMLEQLARWNATELPAAAKQGPPSQRGSSAATPSVRPDHGARLAPSGTATPRRPAGERPEMRPDDPAGRSTELRSGARRMVEALGRMAPLRITKSQWGTVAKLKTGGGTWSTYLSDIRRAGLIDEGPAGYTLTQAGFDYLGGAPEPMTAAELQDHYRTILRSGAATMLDALIAAHPGGLTKDELGEAAGISVTGGTFSTYLSDLVRNGLADRVAGLIVATEILMHGAQL